MLALPLVTVLVVAYTLLVAGVPRPVVGARVYGGPTDDVSSLALRVETVSRDGETERPVGGGTVHVSATPARTPTVNAEAPRDAQGVAEVALAFDQALRGPIFLEVRDGTRVLARGPISLTARTWTAHAHRGGAWIRSRAQNDLVISVAASRGTFVVGVREPLFIRVERAGKPVAGCALKASSDGVRLSNRGTLVTDDRGRARVTVEALEHNATLRVEATEGDGASAVLDTGLPIVPGGLFAERTPSGVVIRSALPPPEHVFYSVVTPETRLFGGSLELAADGRGGSEAGVNIPPLSAAAWIVLSREVDEQSPATIGWSLQLGDDPGQTFDVGEALLLDGLPHAFRLEQTRRSHVRWFTALFALLALALSVALLFLRVRSAERDIGQHLRQGLPAETASSVAPPRLLPLLVGLLVVSLGFAALGLLAAVR